MTAIEWEWYCQNHLNHDWSRNQLILALGKAMNALRREVEDDNYLDRLVAELETEWPAAKKDIRLLLERFLTTCLPRQLFNCFPLSPSGEETLNWLPRAIDLIWKERIGVELLLHAAKAIKLANEDDSFSASNAAELFKRLPSPLEDELQDKFGESLAIVVLLRTGKSKPGSLAEDNAAKALLALLHPLSLGEGI